MRIWDIHPGYLNRQSLLGEHRELHGIVSIMVNGKKGYSRHPETIRWLEYGWALKMRHRLLAEEMALRNFTDKSPVNLRKNKSLWPETYIDHPASQFALLKEKYQTKEPGRIPLPQNGQQLWSHHKYSILSRDPALYKRIGRSVAQINPEEFPQLAQLLTTQLRRAPSPGGIQNALQHMWGHVSDLPSTKKGHVEKWSQKRLLKEVQHRAKRSDERYLLASTALSELMVWITSS